MLLLKMGLTLLGSTKSGISEDRASFGIPAPPNYTPGSNVQRQEIEWPIYKHVPVVRQQYIPTTDIIREYESKRWYDYLKDAFIIFIWIYFIGIMAFFITIWSVSADGSKSYLVDHFSIAMLCVFLISVAFSLLLTISMIWCRQRCGSFVLATDRDAERAVITRHSSRSDITDAFDTENPQGNLNMSFSQSSSPLFQRDGSNSLKGTMYNIYNVPSGFSKSTRMETVESFVPYSSPVSFNKLDPAGCCTTEPQRNI